MMKEQLEAIRKGALEAIAGTKAAAELDALRVKYLGKKGELTAVLKLMGSLSAEERPVMGQMANEVRAAVEKAVEAQSAILEKAALETKLKAETLDVTIPGKEVALGHKHPMYTVLDEIKQVFLDMGFEIMDGPEIELESYNFTKLNAPESHPSRDWTDTFYLTEDSKILLRTQTSPMQIRAMEEHGVPEWYIESLAKIGYLFPKAHAVAYVMMEFSLAWFKVHEPLAFYATFFSIRAKAFDAAECCKDADALRRRIREIENNKDATAVEQDLMTTLEVCYEFCLRGFHFEPIDIYRSDATKFVVTENGLLPPFTSVRGLGETAALDTVEKRKGKDFTSVEEFSLYCNKLSQTHIDQLRALGAFAGLPETSQLTLF